MTFTAYELAVLARADGIRPRRPPRRPGFTRITAKRRRFGFRIPRKIA